MWRKVGDFMFMGEYHYTIDDKGRLTIPAKLRYELGESFIVTRGLDGCLFVYALDNWDKIISKLGTLPFTKKDARTFNRFFMSGATVCEFDKQGRINLPSSLISYANLEKECTIIGVNDRLEIWATDKFDSLIEDNLEVISDISENLFEGFDIDA